MALTHIHIHIYSCSHMDIALGIKSGELYNIVIFYAFTYILSHTFPLIHSHTFTLTLTYTHPYTHTHERSQLSLALFLVPPQSVSMVAEQ